MIKRIQINLFSQFEKPSENQKLFHWFHKGIGLIYLVAIFPLFFQIKALIGNEGLQPAATLLTQSYQQQGYLKSFLQFPSIFHFFQNDYCWYAILVLGCVGAVLLIIGYGIFLGALLSWISFLSITSVGGDFFVIIIDLFLAEIGFLALFSTYYQQTHHCIPKIVDTAFRVLNFRLWFCMGMNKFFMPLDVWTDFTFFNYFFHAQPMPSPIAPYFNNAPAFLKYGAHTLVILSETIVPFFVFAAKRWRLIAFFLFIGISLLIEISGNYGYFNVLTILLALLILKDGDLKCIPFSRTNKDAPLTTKKYFFAKFLILYQLALQLIYCVSIFNPKPHSPQNHFNYLFTTIKSENNIIQALIKPFKIAEYWRICNPYGVFKGIPYHHAEIRLSGSYDGKTWQVYQFNYLPSAQTDYLGFYAPYYPRLDHLFFYETIAAQNYRWNPLNNFYCDRNPWIVTFISKLLNNDTELFRLLKQNPFQNKPAPKFIKAELFQLSFSKNIHKNWDEKPMGIEKIYSLKNPCHAPIISFEEAMDAVYSKN